MTTVVLGGLFNAVVFALSRISFLEIKWTRIQE